MKPAAFDYMRTESAAEAIAVLAEHGDEARILAGGQSLIPMLNMRLVAPELVVDISRACDLRGIRRQGEFIEIGSAATQSELEALPQLEEELPLIAAALPYVGHYQTRNKGTVCGSIAHADPASELPLCLAVLNGEVELASARGKRSVQGRDFPQGLLRTAREADELILSVRFPRAKAGEGFAFTELNGRHGDFAMVAVAVKATKQETVLGIGGAADKPEVRVLPPLGGSALDDALNEFAWEITSQDDIHAPASYRRHLIRTLGRRCIQEARACLA
jgi:2-furoyl-CoA dehydrogenase FAD binding subunit